jgi:uncharacterized protein (TIRG00374 family)
MKKKGGLVLSLSVSGIAVFWLVQKVSLQEAAQAMQQVNYFWWMSSALIYLVGFFPRGVRWRLMLSAVKKVSFFDSTRIVVLGYAANNLLPFRLGEVVRAYVMGNKNNISRITCIGSIGAERVIDGIVIVSLLGISMISLTVSGDQAEVLKKIFLTCGAVFLSAICLLVLVLINAEKILKRGENIFGNTGVAILEKLIHSLSFFRTRKILINILILSIFIWLIEGAMFVLILWDMGFKNPLTTGYFCLGIINLGILLPSAPGYVGVYQAAAVFAFLAIGYGESAGLSYGLLVHIAQYVPITIIGIIIFIHFGYRANEFYKTVTRTS